MFAAAWAAAAALVEQRLLAAFLAMVRIGQERGIPTPFDLPTAPTAMRPEHLPTTKKAEPMLDLGSFPATWLNLAAYGQDSESRFAALRSTDVLKLERRQTFHQPENDSWMAYLNRDFGKAARILEDARPRLEKMFDDLRQRNVRLLRVRVVDRPITPYLHWELQALLVRAQCGEHIRVVGPDAVTHLEPEGAQTPEVLTLGGHVTYRIAYTDQGVLDGAERYLGSGFTTACTSQIQTLYSTGEDLADFFTREFP